MSIVQPIPLAGADEALRMPRIALMGEFSAGKSTVVNALLGSEVVPTAATATHLPAVWFAFGDATGDFAITQDRTARALADPDLGRTDLRQFAALKLVRPVETLEQFEIIDTPGISDPTLSGDALSLAVELADAVIWCTPANQAWRQSEIARWRKLPTRLKARSLLLVTRADTLGSDRNRDKVRARLEQEAGAEFSKILFLHGRDAMRTALGDSRNEDDWDRCGGAALLDWIHSQITDPDFLPEDRVSIDFLSGRNLPAAFTVSALRSPYDGPPAEDEPANPRDVSRPEESPRDFADHGQANQVLTPIPRGETFDVPADEFNESEEANMTNMSKVSSTDISALSGMAGFIGGCLVDSETGLMMAAEGGANFDLEAAAAGNTEVVKAKHAAKAALGLDDHIEDILITLGTQFHLIRPLSNNPEVFLYVALDKKAANLGMARVQLKNVEKTVAL